MGLKNTSIFRKNLNPYFVETGSYIGEGIMFALHAGFKKIISIEIADKYYDICANRYASNKNVTIIKGDSAYMLFDAIKDINENITFWLDGHHSCGDTGLGAYWSPLIQELKQIKQHPIKTHTIIIDDVRCWREFNPVHGFTINECIEIVKEINKDYTFTYADGFEKEDILICKI